MLSDAIWRDSRRTITRTPDGGETVTWASPEVRTVETAADLHPRYGVPATDHGLDTSADAATNAAAVESAFAAASRHRTHVILPAGTFPIAGLRIPGAGRIIGAGSGRTHLHHMGAGAAITTATPGARTYAAHLTGFSVVAGESGQVGVDMDSMSSASLTDIRASGFQVGFDLWSDDPGGGGCTYNRIRDCLAVQCGIGFRLRHGANATLAHGCRVNVCGVGVDIENCNDNTVEAAQIENAETAVIIRADPGRIADRNRFTNCRVEFCDTGFDIRDPGVRETVVSGLWIDASTQVRFADQGTSTRRAGDLMHVVPTNQVVRLDPGWQLISGGSVGCGTSGTFSSYHGQPALIKGQTPDAPGAVGCWVGNSPGLTDGTARIVGFCADTPGAHTQPRAYVRADGAFEFAGGPLVLSGAGSPEGSAVAPPGSLYLRSDGGAGTCMYVKETGTGVTGWVAK